MRVDAVLAPDPAEQLELPWQSGSGHYLDIRRNARAIYQIAAARQHPPLGRFLATVNSEDSVFATATARVQSAEPISPGASCHFSCRIALLFADERFNFDTSHYEGLLAQLQKLLGSESGPDLLALTLRIGPCRFAQLEREGFHLALTLGANGASPEQAELRWGLGLARVQQALLFLSRVVRQHLGDHAPQG
jgi:hypothetical protein